MLNFQVKYMKEQIKTYFDKAGPKRLGDYFTQVKKLVVIDLISEGLTNRQITDLIGIKHDLIWYYKTRIKDNPEVLELVKPFYKEWILKGLYPRTRIQIINGIYSKYMVITDHTDLILDYYTPIKK